MLADKVCDIGSTAGLSVLLHRKLCLRVRDIAKRAHRARLADWLLMRKHLIEPTIGTLSNT